MRNKNVNITIHFHTMNSGNEWHLPLSITLTRKMKLTVLNKMEEFYKFSRTFDYNKTPASSYINTHAFVQFHSEYDRFNSIVK